MQDQTIRLVARNYDFIMPLVIGDVVADGLRLSFDRATPIGAFLTGEEFDAGEMSFSQYLRRLAAGDREIVGLPVFLMRGFRQRCFFVRRGSPLRSLSDLAGKRVGTNGWPDTGNTWSRSLLTDEGIDLEEIAWWVGAIDGVTDEAFGHRMSTAGLPAHVTPISDGRSLLTMLLDGDLDALMIPWPPRAFNEADGPIARLLPDYRSVEREYARRVGFCPGHHILGVRRTLLDRDPTIARSLFDAFERSRLFAEEWRMPLADTSPWLLADLEETIAVLGRDWQAHGVEPNRPMIAALAGAIFRQGIVERAVAPEEVFAEFERLIES